MKRFASRGRLEPRLRRMLPVAATLLTAAHPVPPAEPLRSVEILADTNRDGRVDAGDRADKAVWTAARGAILLPNLGDSARRCPKAADRGFSDAQLAACNDAEGNVARAPENFAPVRTAPLPALSAKATGQVLATGPGADKLRIFLREGGGWRYLAPGDRLTAAALRAGLEIGVDARDVARDAAIWDGRVALVFRVVDGGRQAEDQVALRVAPVIIHNHLEKAVDVYGPDSGSYAPHRQFMRALDGALAKAGFAKPAVTIRTNDNWAQDFVEFGYVSMPAPDGGQRVIRIALRSPQPGRAAGRTLFDLRGPGLGVVQLGGTGYHQVDSFGNLEAAPPYALNGKAYPVGRAVYGDAGDGVAPHSDWMAFFAAQEVQAPIVLDTSWLAVGHVDEFIQFLPADNARGWTIAVKDVDAALALLRKAQAEGHGATPAFSHEGVGGATIDQLLGDAAWLRMNTLARRKIALNLEILQAETGVADDAIVRVPGLFGKSDFHDFVDTVGRKAGAAPQGAPPPEGLLPPEHIVYGPGELIAFYPAPVNGLLVDRSHYIAPRQWGPVIDGVDILQQAVASVYAKAGIDVQFVDDWRTHHAIGGEVHCGTNATREIGAPWWR